MARSHRSALYSQNGALCGITAALDCRRRAFVRGRADRHSHHEAAEIERAIETFARAPNGGLVVLPDATTLVHRESIIARAAQHRVVPCHSKPSRPTVTVWRWPW